MEPTVYHAHAQFRGRFAKGVRRVVLTSARSRICTHCDGPSGTIAKLDPALVI